MNRLIIAVAITALAGCSTERQLSKVQPPREVTVVVERTVELPAWATAPLDRPQPETPRVGAVITSHDARGRVIDYANCRSRLIERIGRGEKIERDTCATP